MRSIPPETRFWSKVNKTSSCWLWTATTRKGYGIFSANSRNIVAHRYSYEAVHGPIPAGMLVCHTCDVRACVNPAHLFVGTYRDNMVDMTAKGRGKPGRPQGTRNGHAKLTETQVQDIRARYALGGITHRALASEFGVGKTTISYILRSSRWKHLP